jgi:hemoglobin/transferrin/lactoferrin receptor protein
MFLRTLTLMLGAWAFATGLYAQTVTFRDQVTNELVADAEIICTTNTAKVTTNAAGQADVSTLKDCGVIQVAHVSFQDRTLTWTELSSGADVLLSYRVHMLDQVVTSASRFEEKRKDVPEKIDVIKARDIRFMDQPTMAELLQNTGSVFVQKSQLGGGSPIIRGFEANRILLVVDGVRMNNAIYRAGHLQDIITVDQSMLERVEIVSGPNSVAYGSDALGGTIHMITRTPKFKTVGGKGVLADAFVRYGTAAEELTGHVGFELRGSKIASYTSISRSQFGDLRQGNTRSSDWGDVGATQYRIDRINDVDTVLAAKDRNVQYGTAYDQLDLMEKLRFKSGENTVHQLNLQYSTSSDIPRYDRTSLFSRDADGNIIPGNSEWYYGPQNRLLAAYTLELARTSGIFDKARFTPSYQSIDQTRNSRGWNSSRLGVNEEKVGVIALNADLEKKMGKNEIRYGVEYTNNDVQSKAFREHIETGEITYRTTRYPGGGSTVSSIAAYVSRTKEMSDKVVISQGLRFTNVDLQSKFADADAFQYLNGTYKQNSSALTWRAGLMYLPGHDWRFSLLGSSGFRAPNVDDMGKVFEVSSGVIVVPNTDLRPETTTNFEVAISKTVEKTTTIDLNGFYTLYNNALTIDAFQVNGESVVVIDSVPYQVTALTNKREAYLYGFSAQMTDHISDRFTLHSSVTCTHGRIRTDSTDAPLDHVPPVYGRAGLEYQAKKFRMEAYVVFNSWKRLRNVNTAPGSEDNLSYSTPDGVPAWATMNVRGSYAFTKNVSLQLGLENIADDFYRVYASGTSAPGRNFTVSLRANF